MTLSGKHLSRSSNRRVLVVLGIQGALLGIMNGFSDLGVANRPPAFVFCGVLSGGIFLWARWRSALPTSAAVFWGGVILLRLVVLPMHPSDDIWRYLWEGKVQVEGYNPYQYAPSSGELAELYAQAPYASEINHPSWPAIYPPLAQGVFWFLARVGAGVLGAKLLFILADLAVVFLLVRLARSFRSAALYAWNPLVIISFAGRGHFDSLMVLALVGSAYCLQKMDGARSCRWRWAWAASFTWALAVSVKIVPLLLLPYWAWRLRGWGWVSLGMALAIPVGGACLYGWPEIPVFKALLEFGKVARTNDFFWWMLELLPFFTLSDFPSLPAVAIIIAVIATSFWAISRQMLGALPVLASALLLSPVCHPWYLTWILPWVAWRGGSPFWLTFSASSMFYYCLWWSDWQQPLWLRLVIVIPPLMAGAYSLFFLRAEEKKPTLPVS